MRALLLLSITAMCANSQPLVTVTSLDAEHVYLSRASETAADDALLHPERDQRLDALVPYAAVIRNESDKEIIAYSIRWICTDPFGRTGAAEVTHFDFSSFRSATNLPAHASRVVSNINGLGSQRLRWEQTASEADQLLNLFQKQRSIVISLDAVAFEDGSASGPDPKHWIPRWKAYIDADAEVYGMVSRRVPGMREQLRSFAALAFGRARSLFREQHDDVDHLQLAVNQATTYEDCYLLARGLFAAGLLERMDRNGEEATVGAAREFTRNRKHPNIHRKEL